MEKSIWKFRTLISIQVNFNGRSVNPPSMAGRSIPTPLRPDPHRKEQLAETAAMEAFRCKLDL